MILEPIKTYYTHAQGRLSQLEIVRLTTSMASITLYPPISDTHVDDMTTDRTRLRAIGEERILRSGDLVALVTADTKGYPVPDIQLLALYAAVSRVRSMAGMAQPKELERLPDHESQQSTYGQHARILAQSLAMAFLEHKQREDFLLREDRPNQNDLDEHSINNSWLVLRHVSRYT